MSPHLGAERLRVLARVVVSARGDEVGAGLTVHLEGVPPSDGGGGGAASSACVAVENEINLMDFVADVQDFVRSWATMAMQTETPSVGVGSQLPH